MSDDDLLRANEREIFEAIVSQLEDPEGVRLRRVFVLLSIGLFVLGSVAVTVVGQLGWRGLCAFCFTFVPGLVLGWKIHGRRLDR